MRARRAMLYVPGDDERKVAKAAGLSADSVCLDIEDGVAVNRKAAAREQITHVLQSLDFGRSERLVRINPVGSGLEADDLAAVLPAHPDGIVLPKVEHPDQVRWVCTQISAAEQRNGWQPGAMALLILIETAPGVVNLKEICAADARLQGLIFGAEDLAGNIGAVRTRAGWEIFYARSAVVIHAAAFGLQAIDMVWMDLHDLDGLREESLQGAGLAYTGKQIIHPNQIEPVQAAFTPSQDAVAAARRVIEAAAAHQKAGKGAFALDGKMVDAPVVKAAERVMERARAAGMID